jgi:hypothetical protein
LVYEKWFFLKCKKNKIIKFDSNYLNNVRFQILYKAKLIQEEINSKFLALEIDKHMNWRMHIQLILPKLSSVCCAMRCMKHYNNIETLKKIYHAYFHSIVTYGVIFGVTRRTLIKFFSYKSKLQE